jgi:hypothetical protein
VKGYVLPRGQREAVESRLHFLLTPALTPNNATLALLRWPVHWVRATQPVSTDTTKYHSQPSGRRRVDFHSQVWPRSQSLHISDFSHAANRPPPDDRGARANGAGELAGWSSLGMAVSTPLHLRSQPSFERQPRLRAAAQWRPPNQRREKSP